MTTLSFSIDPMLPMIVQGLEEAGAIFADTFRAWYTREFFDTLSRDQKTAAAGRVKRQSIRAERPGAASPWARITEGSTLHVKWKARHPTLGRPIATVKASQPAAPITIQRGADGVSVWVNGLDTFPANLAHLDGFNSLDEFAAYFVPKPGDVFRGFLIRW